MIALYIIEIICHFISAAMLVYFFNNTMPSNKEKYNKLYVIIAIIIYTLISLNITNNVMLKMQYNKMIIFTIACYALTLIYPIFFRQCRIAEKFFLSLFYITIMIVSSFVVCVIFANVFMVKFHEILIYINYKRIIVMIVTRVVQSIFIFIFLNNINFIKYIQNRTLYICGIILILNHTLILGIERILIENANVINTVVMYSIFTLCAIQILLISMLNIISKEIENKFMLKINVDRKVHDEEILGMYSEIIGWKHDCKNHISMILGLLEVGTKNDAISYINEINSSINKLDKKIYTNNISINSILISKMKIAKEKGIEVNLDFKIDTEIEIRISDVDICIILGNLFDNAIEACSIVEGHKYIKLTIASEASRLIIKISNTTNGNLNEVNGEFLTTKNDGIHGIGLIQVDSIVKKYNGYINRKHENNIFTTYLMIQYDQ